MTLKIRNEGTQRAIFDPFRKPIFTPTTAKTCTFLSDNRSLLFARYATKEQATAIKVIEGASMKPASLLSTKGLIAKLSLLMGLGSVLHARSRTNTSIKQEKPTAVVNGKIDDREIYMLLLPMNHL